ncbi:MAG: NADH-quinone oxidoreductase subunit J [Anaerolineales bacterium]
MNAELVLFFFLALVAVGAALGLLFSRSAIYAALFLVLNFITVAVFYLMLNAPFLAMAQVTVYAGAIMVLFLFVIMLLGTSQLKPKPENRWQRILALVLGGGLLAEIGVLFILQGRGLQVIGEIGSDFGSPEGIGLELFQQYLLPFEITSILLLVAMIGAIVLTRND